MPAVMSSVRGPVRASGSGGGTLNGSIPRREPLRRLYPLQRARTHSDSIRDFAHFSTALLHDENCSPKTVVLIDPDRAEKRLSVRSAGGAVVATSARSGSDADSTGPLPRSGQGVATVKAGEARRSAAATAAGAEKAAIVYSRPSLIRRVSDVGSVSSAYSGVSLACPVHGDTASTTSSGRSSSILKRPSSRVKSARDLQVTLAPKQVQFCPNVSVVHMDEDGEHLLTHFQQLNGEKRKRLGTLSRQAARNYDNVLFLDDDKNLPASASDRRGTSHTVVDGSSHTTAGGGVTTGSRDGHFRDLFKRLTGGSGSRTESASGAEENTPLRKGQFNITFTSRSGEPTRMRFVLHMGTDYNPSDLVVKANTTGSRIRVVANGAGSIGGSGNTASQEFNEKYMLPMDIDPYEIEARLDKWGNLTVEAPLLSADRRAEMMKSNSNNNAASFAIYV